MAYGHAERTLAAIRLLEAQTAEFLRSLPRLDAEQARWLNEVTQAAAVRAAGRRAGGGTDTTDRLS